MLHQVVQVFPQEDYTVYVYFVDGVIKRYDVRHLVGSGVFEPLSDIDWYLERCTVLNGTLAWDRSGHYDPRQAIDIDPEVIYHHGESVSDPLESPAWPGALNQLVEEAQHLDMGYWPGTDYDRMLKDRLQALVVH